MIIFPIPTVLSAFPPFIFTSLSVSSCHDIDSWLLRGVRVSVAQLACHPEGFVERLGKCVCTGFRGLSLSGKI